MKRFLLFNILILKLIIGNCQHSEGQELFVDVADTYVISIKLAGIIYSGNCICGMEGIKESDNCNLYFGTVDSLYLVRDTSVFSPHDLLNRQYFVISSKENINLNNRYLAFCSNSTTTEYLVVNKLDSTNTKYTHSAIMPTLIGLVSCYNYTFWQKISLFFGSDRSRIEKKAKERFKEHNPFLQAINNKKDDSIGRL